MISTRLLRRAKVAALTALLAGGTLVSAACTSRDLRDTAVAATLDYVGAGVGSFWSTFVPIENVWQGVFIPEEQQE